MKAGKGKYKLKPGVAGQVIKGSTPNVSSAEDLTHDDLFSDQNREPALGASETDESENEGLGDGNIGRATRSSEE